MEQISAQLIKESSPFLRRKDNLSWMLLDVIIALAPTLLWSYLVYGVYAIRNVMIPAITMVASELVFLLIRNHKVIFSKDPVIKKSFFAFLKPANIYAPLISGIIFGLMFQNRDTDPTWLIYFILVVGALFGIIFGKLVFGGTGRNIFNPAAVAFIFCSISFGSKFTGAFHYNAWELPLLGSAAPFVSSSTAINQANGFLTNTSLYAFDNLKALFLGNINGSIGENCKITVLIGMAYLLIRRDADWRVVLSFFLTFLSTVVVAGLLVNIKNSGISPLNFVLFQLMSGGLLYGMAFMIVDPVTMPITAPARVMFGMLVAFCVSFIRFFAQAPEGMAYSILIGNVLVSFLDYHKWVRHRFDWKAWLAIALIAIVGLGIFTWGLVGKLGF